MKQNTDTGVWTWYSWSMFKIPKQTRTAPCDAHANQFKRLNIIWIVQAAWPYVWSTRVVDITPDRLILESTQSWRDNLRKTPPCITNVYSADGNTAGPVCMRSTCEINTPISILSWPLPYNVVQLPLIMTMKKQTLWLVVFWVRGWAKLPLNSDCAKE